MSSIENHKQSNRKYYSGNKDKCRARGEKFRRENPDYHKNYYKENQDEILEKRRLERQETKERVILKELEKFKKENNIKVSKHLEEFYN